MIGLKQAILVFAIVKSGSTACSDPAGKIKNLEIPCHSDKEVSI